MNDLETLLRNEFDEQARSVPDSDEPWRALQRSLTRRRALLVGAAAAALLVVVAIVVPLSRTPAPPAAPTTRPVTEPQPFVPTPGTEFPSGPFQVIESWSGTSGDWIGWVYTKQVDGGPEEVCLSVTAKGDPVNEPSLVSDGPECRTPVAADGPVRTYAFATTKHGPKFVSVLVAVVEKGVHDLVFHDDIGKPVDMKLLTTTARHEVSAVYIDPSTQGFGYDGIDAQGQHFSAIT